jgi:aspartate aminotransferase
MNVRISQRVKELKPSATLAIDAKAKEMIAKGIDVVNLGAGEPDFPTPQLITQAAVSAIHAGFTKYTHVAGLQELKVAIAKSVERDLKVTYDASTEIIASVGAKHSLYNVFLTLLDPGDEVLLPGPYWVSYPEMVGLAGAKAVVVPSTAKTGFVPDPRDMAKAVTPKTRLICLNSPTNPTGAGYPREFVVEMVKLAEEKDLLIVSDEIYRDIVYDGFVNTSPAELGEAGRRRTILVNGVSKTYAMTGWRIGYTAAHADIIKAMTKLQGQSTSNPSSISQKAAAEAFLAPREIVKDMVAEFARRMEFVVGELNSIPGVSCYRPRGAFYVFPDVSGNFGKSYGGRKITDSFQMADFLLEEGKVAAVAGTPFGAEGHIRISFATSMENLKKACSRIREAMAKLA